MWVTFPKNSFRSAFIYLWPVFRDSHFTFCCRECPELWSNDLGQGIERDTVAEMSALAAHVVAWNHCKQNVGSFFLSATPLFIYFYSTVSTQWFSSSTNCHVYAQAQSALHEFQHRPSQTMELFQAPASIQEVMAKMIWYDKSSRLYCQDLCL